MILIKNLQAL